MQRRVKFLCSDLVISTLSSLHECLGFYGRDLTDELKASEGVGESLLGAVVWRGLYTETCAPGFAGLCSQAAACWKQGV